MTGVYRYDSEKNLQTLRSLKKALQHGPRSIADLCRSLDLTPSYVWRLCDQRIDFHIAYYARNRTSWVAQWAWGPGDDAEKPAWGELPRDVLTTKKVKPQPAPRAERSFGFVKQAVARDWSVEMFFGPAVDLNAELRGMHA